jgi:hypothetical protein
MPCLPYPGPEDRLLAPLADLLLWAREHPEPEPDADPEPDASEADALGETADS